jgi:hypothetical protein
LNLKYEDENELQDASSNLPKLVELFQFPGFNKNDITPLPYNVKMSHVQAKVIKSITILNQQVYF